MGRGYIRKATGDKFVCSRCVRIQSRNVLLAVSYERVGCGLFYPLFYDLF